MKFISKNSKKINLALLSLLILFLIPISIIFADDLNIKNPLVGTSDITTLVENILNFLWKLAWAIAPILIVYAGFLYITSAGNEEKVKTAQKTLIWALVGFAVVLIASGVPAIIKDFLSEEEKLSGIGESIGGAGVGAGAAGGAEFGTEGTAEPDSGEISAPAKPYDGETSEQETPVEEEKIFVKICLIGMSISSEARCVLAEWIGTGTKPDDQCTTASECESLVFKFCGVDNLCHQRIWNGTQSKPDNECEKYDDCQYENLVPNANPPTETPIEETGFSEKTGKYKICRDSNWSWLSGNKTLYCKEATWTGENPGDECSVMDEVCQEEAF